MRHRRKCVVCHHPDREAIEEEYLHWHSVPQISRHYHIEDYRSIHRHARACGLISTRRENVHAALDNIISQSDQVRVSADSVINAIRALSCLTKTGRWIERPAHVVHSVHRPDPTLRKQAPALQAPKDGTRAKSLPAERPAFAFVSQESPALTRSGDQILVEQEDASK